MVSINASHAAAGHAATAGLDRGPNRAASPQLNANTPVDPDVVDLSPQGEVLAGDGPSIADRGKASQSPAHMARAFEGESDGPFGQLVRQFAQGTPPTPLAPPAPLVDDVLVDSDIVVDVETQAPPATDPVEDPVIIADTPGDTPTPTPDPALIAAATLAESLLEDESEDEEAVPAV